MEQGYSSLPEVFSRYNESYTKKEHGHLAFFIDNLEPACESFVQLETYERNRKLFYVACSRPKRLALLFTQELSTVALRTLTNWFGADTLEALTF